MPICGILEFCECLDQLERAEVHTANSWVTQVTDSGRVWDMNFARLSQGSAQSIAKLPRPDSHAQYLAGRA